MASGQKDNTNIAGHLRDEHRRQTGSEGHGKRSVQGEQHKRDEERSGSGSKRDTSRNRSGEHHSDRPRIGDSGRQSQIFHSSASPILARQSPRRRTGRTGEYKRRDAEEAARHQEQHGQQQKEQQQLQRKTIATATGLSKSYSASVDSRRGQFTSPGFPPGGDPSLDFPGLDEAEELRHGKKSKVRTEGRGSSQEGSSRGSSVVGGSDASALVTHCRDKRFMVGVETEKTKEKEYSKPSSSKPSSSKASHPKKPRLQSTVVDPRKQETLLSEVRYIMQKTKDQAKKTPAASHKAESQRNLQKLQDQYNKQHLIDEDLDRDAMSDEAMDSPEEELLIQEKTGKTPPRKVVGTEAKQMRIQVENPSGMETEETGDNGNNGGREEDREMREDSEGDNGFYDDGTPRIMTRNEKLQARKDALEKLKERKLPGVIGKQHIGAHTVFEAPVKYSVIDCGPNFAIGIIAEKGKSTAPHFVHAYNSGEHEWTDMRHTYYFYVQEVFRRIELDGTERPIQTNDMEESLLTRPRNPMQAAGEIPSVFEPSFVTDNVVRVEQRRSSNFLTELPAYCTRDMRIKPTMVEGVYRLNQEIVAGYFMKTTTVGNNYIDPEFDKQAGMLPKTGEVVLINAFKVQGNFYYQLGQCVIAPHLVHKGQLSKAPGGPVVERLYAMPWNIKNEFIKLGGIGDKVANVTVYAGAHERIKGACLMQIAANAHLERKAYLQSQIKVKVAIDQDTGDPMFLSKHRTVFRTIEEPSNNANIRRARATLLKGGCPIILRKVPDRKRDQPGGAPKVFDAEGDEKEEEEDQDQQDQPREYAQTPIIFSGISHNTKVWKAQPWEFFVGRSIYQNAVPRELAKAERKELTEGLIEERVARLDLKEPEQIEEAKKKLRMRLEADDELEPELEDVEQVIGQGRTVRSNRLASSSRKLTEKEERQLKEDKPEASDEFFFRNRDVTSETVLVLQGDERRGFTKHTRRAYENWQCILKDCTLAAKICSFLGGVETLPYEAGMYRYMNTNKKLKWAERLFYAESFLKPSIIAHLKHQMGDADSDEADSSDDEETAQEKEKRKQAKAKLPELTPEMKQAIQMAINTKKQSEEDVTNLEEIVSLGSGHTVRLSLDETMLIFTCLNKIRREKAFDLITKAPSNDKLTERQRQVIKDVKDFMSVVMVQAPGGTGKTLTLAHVVDFLMNAHNELICVTAEQNYAVLQAIKMIAEEIPKRTKEKIKPYSLFLIRSTSAEMKAPISDNFKEILDSCLLKDHLQFIYDNVPVVTDKDGFTKERKAAIRKYLDIISFDEAAQSDLMAMNRYVLKFSPNLRVVALTTANLMLLRHAIDATTLLVDEAGQSVASDISMIIADTKVEQLISFGDIFQLEPYVDLALKNKCFSFRHASLIAVGRERMEYAAEPAKSLITLNVCFRFQETNREVISYACYEEFGEPLLSPPRSVQRANNKLAHTNFPWPKKGIPIILLHCAEEGKKETTKSIHNPVQRDWAMRLQKLLALYGVEKGQLKYTTLFNCYYLDEQAKLMEDITADASPAFMYCTISTTQSIQGQERDVNIILTSKTRFSKGEEARNSYLTDDHLFTTAITRGSKCNVIIGDFRTLCDLRVGALSRFVFGCVKRRVPVVGKKWLELCEETLATTTARPQISHRWERTPIGVICHGGISVEEEIWVNYLPRSFEPNATPKERLTNIVKLPIEFAPAPPQEENAFQPQQEDPNDDWNKAFDAQWEAPNPNEPSTSGTSAFANTGFGGPLVGTGEQRMEGEESGAK